MKSHNTMESKDEFHDASSDLDDTLESTEMAFFKKPLYFWIKSFAPKELDDVESFSNFVSSNALSYALEYIGISSDNEQSSLHLSAIFDEDSQHSRTKYPTHYESETKSRIQHLNRVFIELQSYFEDHFSQLVAIRPPNSVHIASSCVQCCVTEFEKILFLLLGAAIQGIQKQDSIRKIKRFPQATQEALIDSIKMIADNPELIHIKPWSEVATLDAEEQKKIYESLLGLCRRLIMERNDVIQSQYVSDYFAGYMTCDQKRIYEGKQYGLESEFDKLSDDQRINAVLRQLREELHEKSELLQECREELETARTRVHELETQLGETLQRLRSCKKARDELDALRESQEKANRLEYEYLRMKNKMEETEHIFERAESLETENRNLQLKNDILLDQISFLTLDHSQTQDETFDLRTPRRSNGFDNDAKHQLQLSSDMSKLFDSDDEAAATRKESVPPTEIVIEKKSVESQTEELMELSPTAEPEETKAPNPLQLCMEMCEPQEDSLGCPAIVMEDNPDNDSPELTSTSTQMDVVQVENAESTQHVPVSQQSSKRRRRRSSVNIKRTRRAIFIPVRMGQRSVPVAEIEAAKNSSETGTSTVKVYKVYNMERSNHKRACGKPKRVKPNSRRSSDEKQVVPTLDVGNDADEELSISPSGLPNDSDIDFNETNREPIVNENENDSDIYFVCTANSAAAAPGRNNFSSLAAMSINATGTAATPPNPNNGVRHHHVIHQVNVNANNNNNVCSSTVHFQPLLKMSNGVNLNIGQQSDSDPELTPEDPNNELIGLGDYNIQLSLRNKSIKPATARINKISTLSANLNLDMEDDHRVETSSEDDDSVWYEYGCV